MFYHDGTTSTTNGVSKGWKSWLCVVLVVS